MSDLPSFLSPLLQDTPGARLKILVAWDSLPVDLQLGLLDAPRGIPLELALKAIASPNAYVRYLAACRAYDFWWYESRRRPGGDGGVARVEGEDRTQLWRDVAARLRDDSDPLVRHAWDERAGWPYERGIADSLLDAFLHHPLEARLARLRGTGSGLWSGERAEGFARLVRRALTGGLLTEHEVVAMVNEYLGSPSNTKFTKREGFGSFSPDDTLNVLWRLVPDVPKSVAEVLVAKLPASTMLFDDIPGYYEIPDDMLESLDHDLLERVLCRDDVGCGQFRKKIALTHQPEERWDRLITAATCRDFDLTDEEFERLLTSDVDRLALMGLAHDLRPVVLKAAADFFDKRHEDEEQDDRKIEHDYWDTARRFEATYEEQLRRLRRRRAGERREHVWQLRLYDLAKDLASRETEDELARRLTDDSEAWVREYVVGGDVWKTYMSLETAARHAQVGTAWDHAKWDAVLPKLDEEELSQPEPYVADVLDPETLRSRRGNHRSREARCSG
jgi:hypothetical protein